MSKYDTDLDYVILGIDITRKELEEIKAEADKIISENKESKENMAAAYLKKAQCLRKLGSWRKVGFIFYDEASSFFYKDGELTIENKDIKRILEKALELSPDMPEALMQLGLLNYNGWYGNINNLDVAKDFFSRAIQQKPNYAAAYNNRAMMFYETIFDLEGKDNSEKNKINYTNAVEDLTEAIKIRPLDALYHLNRGVFHSRLEEHKEAIEDFSSAINCASDKLKELLNTEVLILNLRGKEYLELKEYDKAIADFSESLQIEPKEMVETESFFYITKSEKDRRYADTYLMRGKAYWLSGEKDKAKADFKEYISIKRNSAEDKGREEISHLIGVRPENI